MNEINFHPTRRELRVFSILLAVFLTLVAAGMRHRGYSPSLVHCLLAVGGVSGVVGLALPDLMRPIYIGWMVAVFPIGWLVSHAVLLAVFLGVVTPIGWFLRWRGHDPMHRHFDPSATTYWQPRESRPTSSRYFRPF